MKAALTGQAVDRVPVSFWGHDYLREWSAEGLAQATLEFYRKYDWDYIKVNPRATYYLEDWGCRFSPSGDPLRGPEMLEYAIKSPEDFRRLPALVPATGAFGEQLEALRIIGHELEGEASYVQTVFSPLTVACRLAGGDVPRFRQWLREAATDVHIGLAVITETLATYARLCVEAGASGIFFATVDWGTRASATEDEYREFGRPYDLRVLAAVRQAPFNILHVCRQDNMLDLLLDYPVQAINWAATLPGNPSLGEGLSRMTKAVMGGISEQTTLRRGTPEQVQEEVRQALAQTGGRRLLLAPGCSISPDTPEANLRAALAALEARA